MPPGADMIRGKGEGKVLNPQSFFNTSTICASGGLYSVDHNQVHIGHLVGWPLTDWADWRSIGLPFFLLKTDFLTETADRT